MVYPSAQECIVYRLADWTKGEARVSEAVRRDEETTDIGEYSVEEQGLLVRDLKPPTEDNSLKPGESVQWKCYQHSDLGIACASV